MLGALDTDAQRHHARLFTEVRAVEHQRDQIQFASGAASSLDSAVSVAAMNRRETADLLVAIAARSATD